jgi:hypothetical protein
MLGWTEMEVVYVAYLDNETLPRRVSFYSLCAEYLAHTSPLLVVVQSLAKSASPFSFKKIVSTDHLVHFWR